MGPRIRTAILYFVSGAVVLVVMDFFVDSRIRDALYAITVDETGRPVPAAAFGHIQTLLWISRVSKLAIYALVIYIITGYTLRYLKQSTEIQRRFVALASHELRTPLTVIKNAAEVSLRRKDSLSRDRLIEILDANLSEINRLSDTVQFLLDYSDVTHKRHELRFSLVDLPHIVRTVCRDFDESAHAADLSIRVEIDPGIIRMRANPTALRILLGNLLRNSIKYTKPEGTICVRLLRREKNAVLEVADSGSGISKRDLPHIFDPFYRSHQLDRNTGSGMGLGLSIVRDVAAIHGGKIAATSDPGKGTTMSISFPLITS